ncbi:uncharacterized protein SOCE26_097470 [Sorangium cellulosum]|uniref:LamG-like jellyroll fold domain-containing protein n=1 Tax=Sorangium cellulosum TaxID=56 RepID=A0A2L0F9F1_SORCE|nr:LamG domain-containing protein [Sorangium cellulosum]AUX48216.1 uncharacterized protein SOCE26_097470 [Sorangium cellulosum]
MAGHERTPAGPAALRPAVGALLAFASLCFGACSLEDLSYLQQGATSAGGGGAASSTTQSSSGSSGGSGGHAGGDGGRGGEGGAGGAGGHGGAGGAGGNGGAGGAGGDGGAGPIELERGLFLHYTFDETEGDVAADATGDVLHDGIVFGGTWVPGHLGNALSLSGDEQYVELPPGIVQTLNEITISFWIHLDRQRLWQRAFDFGLGQTAWIYVCPQAFQTGLRFSVNSPAGVKEYSTEGTLPVRQWAHVAVTLAFDPDRSSIYIDGIEEASSDMMQTRPSDLGNTTMNFIGRSQFEDDPYLAGMVDDFRIYDRALSAAEVAALASQ